jgi:hypothetical protein
MPLRRDTTATALRQPQHHRSVPPRLAPPRTPRPHLQPHGTTRLALSLRAVGGFWQTTLIREPARFGLVDPPETFEEFRAAAEPVLQLLQVLLDGTLD